jgi:drug/metabolite transporter (DMT)-like permease
VVAGAQVARRPSAPAWSHATSRSQQQTTAPGAGRRHGGAHALSDTRVLAVVLIVFWGTMFVVQRLALEVAPPGWVGALRVAVAAVVLLPFAGALRGVGRRGLGAAVILGLTNQAGFIGLQVAGLQTVAAGPAAALVYLQPVLVVLASGPLLGEHLTRRRLVGALLGFAGVAIVGLHQATEVSLAGVLFLLAASLSWTVGTLVTTAVEAPILPLVAGQHIVGAPILLAFALATEPVPSFSAKLVSCVVFAGVFGSALGWMLLGTLLRRGEAGTVSTWLFAVPVLAAILGIVVLGESLSVELVIGVALVAVAVRLAAAPVRRRLVPG